MPPEEEGGLAKMARELDLDLIYLAAPTTTDARMQAIGRATSGYLYYVSLKGVTGSSQLDSKAVATKIASMRSHVDVPICVGFGIRTPEHAAEISKVADGVIVGSVLVSAAEAQANRPETVPGALSEVLAPMREAMDRVQVDSVS